MTPPRRRVVLTLTLGADTREDAIRALHVLANDADLDGLPAERSSGGASSGYVLAVDEDETITHESYFEAVEADRAKRRAEIVDA